jgi:hypothetical protein
MTLADVIPIVEVLPHADKFKLMQHLLFVLAKEEDIDLDAEVPKKQDALFTIIGIAAGEETDVAQNHDNYLYGVK